VNKRCFWHRDEANTDAAKFAGHCIPPEQLPQASADGKNSITVQSQFISKFTIKVPGWQTSDREEAGTVTLTGKKKKKKKIRWRPNAKTKSQFHFCAGCLLDANRNPPQWLLLVSKCTFRRPAPAPGLQPTYFFCLFHRDKEAARCHRLKQVLNSPESGRRIDVELLTIQSQRSNNTSQSCKQGDSSIDRE